MNSNKKVLYFVVISVILFAVLSVTAQLFNFKWKPFNNINLVSALFKNKLKATPAAALPLTVKNTDTLLKIGQKPLTDFALYTQPQLITNFNSDTTQSSLPGFFKKVYALRSGNKQKIRVAYFGDSMIEGDLLTQTFRKLMQKEFGGYGVGFVPITSLISKFRSTAYANFSDGWQDENFKTAPTAKNLFFSGHLFYGNNDWVEIIDETVPGIKDTLQKSLLCGYAKEPAVIKFFNASVSFNAADKFNRFQISDDPKRNIRLSVSDSLLPLYGVSFESPSGILIDNFSFRGITGIELLKTDTSLLKDVAANNPYDLFIFEYGVNLLFRPNDTNFAWYGNIMSSIIKKIKKYFPNADVLLISTADRAFRYDGDYKSAIGIDSLIKVQASTAYETGASFYNLFETMGGHNSIVKWADAKPSLARSDYVHPNAQGTDTLATYLFKAVMNDYHKYVNHLK